MGRRTGDFAHRLRVSESGAGPDGVVVDFAAADGIKAAARAGSERLNAAVSTPDGHRRGFTRHHVADLGGARRTGIGVGGAENVRVCIRMRMRACASAPCATRTVPKSVPKQCPKEYPVSTRI